VNSYLRRDRMNRRKKREKADGSVTSWEAIEAAGKLMEESSARLIVRQDQKRTVLQQETYLMCRVFGHQYVSGVCECGDQILPQGKE